MCISNEKAQKKNEMALALYNQMMANLFQAAERCKLSVHLALPNF